MCRWVVINKDPSKAGSVTLRITKPDNYAKSASVARLLATGSDPLTASSGITLAGVTYGYGIAKSGTESTENLAVSRTGSNGEMVLYMPPGSAALVRLPAQRGSVFTESKQVYQAARP